MKRDALDFHEVRPDHAEIHERLLNWARWCRGARGGSHVLPMFQGYRHSYDEIPVRGLPIDSLDGHRLEKLVIGLPDKHRAALQWSYVRPYIPVHRVRRILGVTAPGLFELVHAARAMIRNRACISGKDPLQSAQPTRSLA